VPQNALEMLFGAVEEEVQDNADQSVDRPTADLTEIGTVELKERDEDQSCRDACNASENRDPEDGGDASETAQIGVEDVSDHLEIYEGKENLRITNGVEERISRVTVGEEEGNDGTRKERDHKYGGEHQKNVQDKACLKAATDLLRISFSNALRVVKILETERGRVAAKG